MFIDCLEIQTTVFGQEDCFLQFFFHSLVIGSVLLSAKKKKQEKEIFPENATWSENSSEKGKTSPRHNKT